MSIFDIPHSLLEAIDQVTNPSGWRRDLDIRPLVLIAGLSKNRSLDEVYQGNRRQFISDDVESQKLHDLLTIDIPKSSSAAHSIKHYSGSGYDQINKHLWDNHVLGNEIPSDIKSHVENIKSVLVPETTVSNAKLYTGVKISPASVAGFEWNSTRPVKLLNLPAFTSTSTNFDVVSRFANFDNVSLHHESDHHGVIEPGAKHIIELNFPEKLHDAVSMLNHSNSPHEEEVLLGPNHTFELHPRPTKIEGTFAPTYVWKAVSRGVSDQPMFKQREFTRK